MKAWESPSTSTEVFPTALGDTALGDTALGVAVAFGGAALCVSVAFGETVLDGATALDDTALCVSAVRSELLSSPISLPIGPEPVSGSTARAMRRSGLRRAAYVGSPTSKSIAVTRKAPTTTPTAFSPRVE
ncbi:MAG: hypothetical protein HYR89_07280 [Actinobacteria bacterium]|nr:hypothetical protein [Actinomycetota bacterium]